MKLLTPSRYADGGLSIQDPYSATDPGKQAHGPAFAAGVAVAHIQAVLQVLKLDEDVSLDPSPHEATEFAEGFYSEYEPKGANYSILRAMTARFITFSRTAEEVLKKIASSWWDGAGNRADVLLGIAGAAQNGSPQAREYAAEVLKIQHVEYAQMNERMVIVGVGPPSRGMVLSYHEGRKVCTEVLKRIPQLPGCTGLSRDFVGNCLCGKKTLTKTDIEVTGSSFECRQWLRATAAFAGRRSSTPENTQVVTTAIAAITAKFPSLTLEAAAAKAALGQ